MLGHPPRSTFLPPPTLFLFFFNDTATTEIYTLSLHDALPISYGHRDSDVDSNAFGDAQRNGNGHANREDRKSTRLNSSHQIISYAVFCLKKKKHTSELQSPDHLVCRLLLEKTKNAGKSYNTVS